MPTPHQPRFQSPVYVASIDMDGCAMSTPFSYRRLEHRLAPLVQHLIKNAQAKGVTQIGLISGSSRQTFGLDVLNTFRNKNTYTPIILHKIKAMLERRGFDATLHTYMLGDRYPNPYRQINYGATFQAIENFIASQTNARAAGGGLSQAQVNTLYAQSQRTMEPGLQEGWEHNPNKRSLLQKQMSYLIRQYPQRKIDFEFIDDRYDLLQHQVDEHKSNGNSYKPAAIELTLTRYASSESLATFSKYNVLPRSFGQNAVMPIDARPRVFAPSSPMPSVEIPSQPVIEAQQCQDFTGWMYRCRTTAGECVPKPKVYDCQECMRP